MVFQGRSMTGQEQDGSYVASYGPTSEVAQLHFATPYWTLLAENS